ncbi:hypothetical protein Dip510_000351 [Elusimicrobium posterum]|uniref:zinc-ribbon domain-containing protein n=1 Tax=Elusimicrobium posterum TaxID=3116653 RepID=UPI003C766130
MYCKSCGKNISGNSKFCAQCGAPLNSASAEQPQGQSSTAKGCLIVFLTMAGVAIFSLILYVIFFIVLAGLVLNEMGVIESPKDLLNPQKIEKMAEENGSKIEIVGGESSLKVLTDANTCYVEAKIRNSTDKYFHMLELEFFVYDKDENCINTARFHGSIKAGETKKIRANCAEPLYEDPHSAAIASSVAV